MNKKILLKFLIVLGIIEASFQASFRDSTILLYDVTSNESVNIIDKTNRISYINGRNNANDFKTDFLLPSQLPKFYNLIFSNEHYMLIGTLGRILNITLSDLNAQPDYNKTYWESKSKSNQLCHDYQLTETEKDKILYTCHNYISGAISLNNSLIVCGTNSNKPSCMKYDKNKKYSPTEFRRPQFTALNRITGMNFLKAEQIPPFLNEKSIYFVNSGSYTIEPTINKQSLIADEKFGTLIKTPKGALKNAQFRASFTHGEKVYFFFYETVSEMDIKNGLTFKTPFSLIGEVCKNDKGKSSYMENINRFITFKKADIYCYLPDYRDGFHQKYSEIQAVSKPIRLSNQNSDPAENDVFYAIFTLRRLNTVDSVLCQYKVSTVQETMTGYFKSSEHNDRIKYKKPMGTCGEYDQMNESNLKQYYNDRTQNYNYKMEESVNEPALFALNNAKFTAIAIDSPNERNNFNEVIFIGLADGRVIKLLLRPTKLKKNGKIFQQPIIVQEYLLFDTLVSDLIVNSESGKLIAISAEKIRSIDLDSSCPSHSDTGCFGCLNSQDPYCAWSPENSKCISIKASALNHKELIKINKNHDILNQCFNMTNNIDDSNIYSVNTKIQLGNKFDSGYYSELKKIRHRNDSTSNLLVAIFLTALLTCLLSVGLTCLLINKRYKMADYISRPLSTTLSSNRSSASSTTSYNNYKTEKFDYKTKKIDSKSRPKYQNFYESSLKPLLENSIFNKKNLNLNPLNKRFNLSSHTPTVNTNVSSSICTQHSPSSELTIPPKSINDTLSSSNESCCFDPQSMSDECLNHNNCDRYTKRNFNSSPISNKKSSSHCHHDIDTIKINTSLLGSKLDASRDSNV